MTNKEIYTDMTIEDLQEQHKLVAEVIGLEMLIKLSQYCGGTQLYIPQMFELTKALVFRKISEEFTGDNIQQLAIKYKVSESTVYRIVRDKISEKRYSPFEGQMGFGDMDLLASN